jgi:hypothetical protein
MSIMTEFDKDTLETIALSALKEVGVDCNIFKTRERESLDMVINSIIEQCKTLDEDPIVREHQLVGGLTALTLLVSLQEIKIQELRKNGG